MPNLCWEMVLLGQMATPPAGVEDDSIYLRLAYVSFQQYAGNDGRITAADFCRVIWFTGIPKEKHLPELFIALHWIGLNRYCRNCF